jgi:ubiquinone/menaquinone biosynthesis C-methylase UbiE
MQEVINRWTESARYWEKHRATIREMFAPITEALIAEARISRGSAVLDLATGPGEPALAIAEFVGREGKVVGVDVVAEMVEAARREADRRKLRNVSFAVAPADALPSENDSFDAVVSRFGIMFFPAPVLAVREMLRVLKPGGKIALAVWHFAERNPFHYTLSRAVEHYVESPAPAEDAPDAFRYAAPGKLRAVLSEAGAAEVSERLLQFSIRAKVSLEEFWTLRSEMTERLRSALAKLPREQMAEVKREAIEALRAYSGDHGVSLPAEVLIVSGRKPS